MQSNECSEYTAGREYVLGHRQLAAIAFVMVGTVTTAAAVAYMVGRASSPRLMVAEAAVTPTVIKVQGTDRKPSPSVASAGSVSRTSLASANDVAKPMLVKEARTEESFTPPKGALYYQVAATERSGLAEIMTRLKAQGIPAWAGEGPTAEVARVYAGPVTDASSQSELRRVIETAGFRPFLKQF
jgi:hypothetical protein